MLMAFYYASFFGCFCVWYDLRRFCWLSERCEVDLSDFFSLGDLNPVDILAETNEYLVFLGTG